MLRQLGNSFIVQPNVLKSYMTESHLGRIDARLLRPYLAQRSDYSTFSKSLQLDDGVGDDVHPVSSSSNNTFNSASGSTAMTGASAHISKISSSAGSRLSVMSGVAGAGMGKLKEMLKEFETMSPAEESEMAMKRARALAAGAGAGGGGTGQVPGARSQIAAPPRFMPMYYGM